MSKNRNTSYEGFRRRNSLKCQQINGLTSSTELSANKIRSKDNLEEIQNLSCQLNDFRQRSLSCNNQKNEVCYSSMNLSQAKQSQPDQQTKKNQGFIPKLALQYRSLRLVQQKYSPNSKKTNSRQQKINGFNQFDIIQQDLNSLEEEFLDVIQPVTNVQTASTSRATERKTAIRINEIKNSQNYHKPLVNTRIDSTNLKSNKLKQDINDIQKMQKQLDNHIKKKETNTKPSINSRYNKEPNPKQLNNKQQSNRLTNKGTQKSSANLQTKIVSQSKNIRNTYKNKNPIQEKGDNNKFMNSQKNIQNYKDQAQNNSKNQDMIATKMITINEKQSLITQLLSLKDTIDKNQICSDNLPQIYSKIYSIKELLTG